MKDYEETPTQVRMYRAELYHDYKYDPKKTQTEMTLQYLNINGSITDLEALKAFDCRRLSARVHDLRRLGYNITTELAKGRKNYAIYRWEK